MVTENIRQEFRLKNIDETRNCFLEQIKQKILMSRKHKKICTLLLCVHDQRPENMSDKQLAEKLHK